MKQSLTRQAVISVASCWLVTVVAVQRPAFAVRNFKIGDSLSSLFEPSTDGADSIYESEQLADRPAAIIFWRPNHELSLEALRDLQAVAQEIGPGEFTLLAVDAKRSTTQEVQAALSEKDISVSVLLDPQRILYERVGLIVCPTTLLFDAKGKLRFVLASHAPHFRLTIQARLRFLLGQIDEQTMDELLEPTLFKIDHDLVAAGRTYNLGKQLQAAGRSDQAKAAYKKAIFQYPALTEAHCALGFLELEAGDLQAAAQRFESSLAFQPNSSAAQLGQAAVLARTKKVQEAEQILLSLLAAPSKPVFVRVRYELARIHHIRGEFEKAAGYYRDALAAVFPEAGANSSAPKTPPSGNTKQELIKPKGRR